MYPIKNLAGGKTYLRVVFIRAKIKGKQLSFLEDPIEDGYQYYSIITNMDRSEKSDDDIIEFYRGRANAENFIREQKNGYDFHHFPCKKLSAKKVRKKLIKLPCQVVRHARRLTVRLMPTTLEVMENILQSMKHNNSNVYEKFT